MCIYFRFCVLQSTRVRTCQLFVNDNYLTKINCLCATRIPDKEIETISAYCLIIFSLLKNFFAKSFSTNCLKCVCASKRISVYVIKLLGELIRLLLFLFGLNYLNCKYVVTRLDETIGRRLI